MYANSRSACQVFCIKEGSCIEVVCKVAHMLSSEAGSKLGFFHSTSQRFPRNWPFFTITTFGHETWRLAKVPEVEHTLFLPQMVEIELIFALHAVVEIELIFALRAVVSEIFAIFQNCPIWV